MAKRKLLVIGTLPVGGVGAGQVVELDDEVINVEALISGQLVEPYVEPPKQPDKKKGD